MFPQSNKCFYKHLDVVLILQESARLAIQAISGVHAEKKRGSFKVLLSGKLVLTQGPKEQDFFKKYNKRPITIKVTLKAVLKVFYFCFLNNFMYSKGFFFCKAISAQFHKEPFQKGFTLPHSVFQFHHTQAETERL